MLKKAWLFVWSVVMMFSLNLLLTTSLLAQATAGSVIRCSECLVTLEVKKCATPQYPLLGRSIHLQGTVFVEVEIDSEGKVISAIPISGPQLLRASSIAAAVKWEFEPRLIDGKPITVRGILTFRFTLDGREPSGPYQCPTN